MTAIFSPCRTWRVRLERELGPGPVVAVFGVNPSKAGEAEDDNDQTVSKDIGFGRRLGWGRLIKGNMFAFISTEIEGLQGLSIDRAVGPDNDAHLRQIMLDADILVAAWGTTSKLPPNLRGRWRQVAAIADEIGKPLLCWGTTIDGQPRHPARIAYATPLVPWERPTC